MEYSKIVSVTGLPGLYELVNNKPDGAIVRSLDDKSTKFASSRIHNFSHLETIEVYTSGENVNLVDVFHAMEESADALPDAKDNGAVRKYFDKVYPQMDFERVYNSDLKKMIRWFEILKKNDIEIKLSEPEEEVAKEPEEAVVEHPVTEKEQKKEPVKVRKAEKERPSSIKKKEERPGKKSSSSSTDKSSKKSPGKKGK